MRRSATPSVPTVGARTRRTYVKRMHPATAEDPVAGSRLTSNAIEAAAHAAHDGIAFTGDAFGTAAYLTALLPIYVSRALSQTATPPIPTE
jgi:CO/xanthine dehydrogenase FAD-binding subunit